MHQTTDIIFGVTGQSLFFDCPEGRPSSVTSATVYRATTGDNGTTESAAGTATVETSPNTTFDAPSGGGQANPNKCSLTATTGAAIGRTYRATNALGQSELVDVVAIAAADYVLARDPLQNVYTTADTFVSTRISMTVDPSWVADQSKLSQSLDPNPQYRVRWLYVVSSVACAHDTYFDLVRYPARHDVSGLDVDKMYPGWLDALPTYHRADQGKARIDEAYRRLKFELYNAGVPDQAVRNREVINDLVVLKAAMLVMPNDTTVKLYYDTVQQLIDWGKVQTSKDSSGAASPGEPAVIWSK